MISDEEYCSFSWCKPDSPVTKPNEIQTVWSSCHCITSALLCYVQWFRYHNCLARNSGTRSPLSPSPTGFDEVVHMWHEIRLALPTMGIPRLIRKDGEVNDTEKYDEILNWAPEFVTTYVSAVCQSKYYLTLRNSNQVRIEPIFYLEAKSVTSVATVGNCPKMWYDRTAEEPRRW